MVKLTIVAGPNRGATYQLDVGETSVGRQTGNVIVLASSKVSKRHCTLINSGEAIEIRDEGSSNGTFINGAATKGRRLASGDRISVGEYVFELTVVKPRAQARAAPQRQSNVIQFPKSVASGPGVGGTGSLGAFKAGPSSGTQSQIIGVEAAAPDDAFGKVVWHFDRIVMPAFYGLLLKSSWRSMLGAVFVALSILTVVISIYPMSSASKNAALRELGKRARYVAEHVADVNGIYLSQRAESKIDLSSVQRIEGLHDTYIIDLENRIIAPSHRAGQNLGASAISGEVARATEEYRRGREQGYPPRQTADQAVVVGIAPIKIVDPQHGRNQVKAVAVVALDSAGSVPTISESNFNYIEALALALLLAGFLFLVAYRLTLKPLEILGDDLDRVLRGDLPQVTKEFKIEELESLWERIGSALQRVPKVGQGIGPDNTSSGLGQGMEDWLGPYRVLLPVTKAGMILFDSSKVIVALNSSFEEITGIRSESAVGQEISAVARDQSVGQIFNDLFARSTSLSDPVTEDYDFSGVPVSLQCFKLGPPGSAGKAFVVFVNRKD